VTTIFEIMITKTPLTKATESFSAIK